MLEIISSILQKIPVKIKVVFKDGSRSDWSNWLTFPSPGYGEIMVHGPFKIIDVNYLEIDAIESKKFGKRIPEKKIDHTMELKKILQEAKINFEQETNILRINLS